MVEFDGVTPDLLEPVGDPVHVPLGHRLAHVLLDDLEQVGVPLLLGHHLGIGAAARKEQDLQRAGRVEPLDAARIHHARCTACSSGIEGFGRFLPDATEVEHRPVAADLDDRLPGTHRVADGRLGFGH